ncbi:DUF819 family protein [Hydrogenimonas sp.]
MIASGLGYLLSVAAVAAFFGVLERTAWARPLFRWLPGVVLAYLAAMALAQTGFWAHSEALTHAYAVAKSNLLPAMLFLMTMQVDLKRFGRLGPRLLSAYAVATLSLAAAFVAVFWAFGFGREEAGLFAALCGSWMGGTGNMLAVGAAFGVDETAMGYALAVDALCYTLWVTLLLAIIPLAGPFARYSGAVPLESELRNLGCACHIGPRRYWVLLAASFAVALLSQMAAARLPGLGTGAWSVLLATLAGLLAARAPLARMWGSGEIAATMLLLLVVLIGSRAHFEDVGAIPRYAAAGLAILGLHALALLLAARRLKLGLFEISVASLANIGGAASAPLLAAAYRKELVGVGVLMAVMGYLTGTLGGLGVGYVLQWIAP